MRNKLLSVVLVVLVLLVAATPALAEKASRGPGEKQIKPAEQYQWRAGDKIFSLVGTVTAVGEGTMTVLVLAGNRNVKESIGLELALVVTEDTKFMQWTNEGSLAITFADVQVGDVVNVHGEFVDGVYTATRVTADVPYYCSTR